MKTMLINVIAHPLTYELALKQQRPDWSAPGVKLGNSLFAAFIAIALIVCGIAVVGGGAALAIGRFMSHGAAQKVGLGLIIGGVVGGAVIGSAAAIVNFGNSKGV